MDRWHIGSWPKHSSLFTSTRGVYQLLQIQIYVNVLQNGWVTLGWPKKQNFLIFSKNMKYVSYMNYLRPMIILESLKTPHRLCTIDLNFTKDFSPKYKGNICILVFWRFTIILFLWNDFKSLRSFCLINTLLLIPILP